MSQSLAFPEATLVPEATAVAPTVPLDVHVVSTAAEAERLRPEWHALLARSAAAANGLTLTPEWLLTWWREFGSLGGRQLRLTLFRRGERLVGLAPLLRRRVWHAPGLPFRRLEFLATGEPPSDAICSDYLNVVAERGAEADVAAALVRSIERGDLGTWDEAVLSMMDGDGAMPGLLADSFQAAGVEAERRSLGEAPYITLPATWEAYLQSLSANGRRLVKSSLKAFDDWAKDTARLDHVRDSADLEKGKQILIQMHRERWADGGTFHSPRFLCFHDTIMAWRLSEGELELLALYAHGEPIAALYNLVWDGKVYFYQCGRKMDVPDCIRPGVVLFALSIRAAIEAGRREFDFLNGATTYKKQLARLARPLVEIRAVRRSWREKLRRLAEYGRGPMRALKKGLQRALGWMRGA